MVRTLIRLLLLLALPLGQLACGGGGGALPGAAEDPPLPQGGLREHALAGTLDLPIGAPPLAELRLETVMGESTAAPDGRFQGPSLAPGRQLVLVGEPGEEALLIGFLGDAQSRLDCHSTAVALLFSALGGPALPDVKHAELLVALEEAPETQALADAVCAAIEGGATSLVEGRDRFLPALLQAKEGLRARRGGPLDQALRIQPGGPMSGILLDEHSSQSLEIVNTYRRRAVAFVKPVQYVVHEEGSGTRTIPITDGTSTSTDISPVQGISSTLSTIWAWVNGQGFWEPVRSDPIQVPVTPEAATATDYEVYVAGLGNAMGPGATFADLTVGQQVDVGVVWFESLFLDFMLPFFLNAVLPTGITLADGRNAQELATMFNQLRLFLSTFQSYIPSVTAALTDEGASGRERVYNALAIVVDAFAADPGAPQRLAAFFATFARTVGSEAARTAIQGRGAAVLSRGFAALTIADIIVTCADSIMQIADVARSHLLDKWTVRSTRGRVSLTPPHARTDPQTPVSFTAALLGNTDTVTYTWEVAQGLGGLAVDTDAPATRVVTTEPSVRFVPSGDADGTETITVSVHDIQGSLLGAKSGTIDIFDREALISLDEVSVRPGDTVSLEGLLNPRWDRPEHLSYRWSCAEEHGQVLLPAFLDSPSRDKTLRYRANANTPEGSMETVSLEISWQPPGEDFEVLGTAEATIYVETRPRVVPGTFRIVIAPVDEFGTVSTTAYVVFPPQADAVSYEVIGTGGFDPFFYGSSIRVRQQASSLVEGPLETSEPPPEISTYEPVAGDGLVGLSAAFGINDGSAVPYMEGRFRDFLFKVRVTYGD